MDESAEKTLLIPVEDVGPIQVNNAVRDLLKMREATGLRLQATVLMHEPGYDEKDTLKLQKEFEGRLELSPHLHTLRRTPEFPWTTLRVIIEEVRKKSAKVRGVIPPFSEWTRVRQTAQEDFEKQIKQFEDVFGPAPFINTHGDIEYKQKKDGKGVFSKWYEELIEELWENDEERPVIAGLDTDKEIRHTSGRVTSMYNLIGGDFPVLTPDEFQAELQSDETNLLFPVHLYSGTSYRPYHYYMDYSPRNRKNYDTHGMSDYFRLGFMRWVADSGRKIVLASELPKKPYLSATHTAVHQ